MIVACPYSLHSDDSSLVHDHTYYQLAGSKDLWEGDKWGRRRVLEVLVLQNKRLIMNRDVGLILDPLWTYFIRPRSNSHVTESATTGVQILLKKDTP